jgi:hypothetical protein
MLTISPKFKLIDLCGPGYVYNARVPDNAAQWVFESPAIADASTGNQVTILGRMPVLCSAGVATEAGLALLHDLGFEVQAELVTYTDAGDRLNKMRQLAAQGLIFIDQHVQTDPSLHPGTSWVDPMLLSSLNNKGNLSSWVPALYLPRREICELTSLSRLKSMPERFPLILKAVTEASCGSGKGVQILRDPSGLDEARNCFASCDSVIVEDYIAMDRNLCVNYAVFADGRIEYIGVAQQIISDETHYMGNWLEPPGGHTSHLIHVGFELMQKAYQLGYRGFAGFDAAVGEDGSFHIYDLNFRFNGSTVPLLLYDSLVNRTGLPVAKNGAWKCKSSFDDMIKKLPKVIEKFQLIPINTFDPTRCYVNTNAEPQIKALLFGTCKEDIEEKEKELVSLGIY